MTKLNRLGYTLLGLLLLIASYAILTGTIQGDSDIHSLFAATIFGTGGIIILFATLSYDDRFRK